ncbi:tautomerase family protein [Rhodococcus sp. IEGM1300]
MPVITVELFPGRTPDTKRELIKALTDSYVNVCGGTAQGITILLKEVDPVNWGSAGRPYADVIAENAHKSS